MRIVGAQKAGLPPFGIPNVSLADLQAIAGVQSVEPLEGNRFRLHYTPEHSPAEQLVELAVQQGWGLFEVIPERITLEEVFVDITRTEPSHEEDAA